jgi:hypothetical protein
MNLPISHRHAAICFAVLSLYSLVCGLGCLALVVAHISLDAGEHFPWLLAIDGLILCLLSILCTWAAWALFKRKPNAGLIAMIVWLLVGALTAWSLYNVAFRGWDSVGIVVVAVLSLLEFLIGIYLIERRHKPAA